MNLKKYFYIWLLVAPMAIAAPGAHGPNGEHLDGAGGAHAHSDAGPRIETFTESFELVGYLQEDELSILIDRYDTNVPVLNGVLEVEYKGIKAPAKFHADHGDYSMTDAQLLKALAAPGKHALIFTFTAGQDSDLLEGTMDTKAHEDQHGQSNNSRWTWGALALAVLGAATALIVRRQRKQAGRK